MVEDTDSLKSVGRLRPPHLFLFGEVFDIAQWRSHNGVTPAGV